MPWESLFICGCSSLELYLIYLRTGSSNTLLTMRPEKASVHSILICGDWHLSKAHEVVGWFLGKGNADSSSWSRSALRKATQLLRRILHPTVAAVIWINSPSVKKIVSHGLFSWLDIIIPQWDCEKQRIGLPSDSQSRPSASLISALRPSSHFNFDFGRIRGIEYALARPAPAIHSSFLILHLLLLWFSPPPLSILLFYVPKDL